VAFGRSAVVGTLGSAIPLRLAGPRAASTFLAAAALGSTVDGYAVSGRGRRLLTPT